MGRDVAGADLKLVTTDFFIPSPEDTLVSEDHFETPLSEEEKNLISLQQYLEQHQIEAVPLAKSHFGSLEGVIQEMDEHFPLPTPKLAEGVRQFKTRGFLPLVMYHTNGEGPEFYLGVQGVQRQSLITAEEARHLTAEEIYKRRGFRYDANDTESIAYEIAQTMRESPLFNKLKTGRIQTKLLLLGLNEFDTLERCLLDTKHRKDQLGEIDEADTGEKTMWKIFERAVELGATDVHIEPWDEKSAYARYRIDGDLKEEKIPRKSVPSIVSAIKVKAKMPIEDRRKAWDGGIHFTEEFFTRELLDEHSSLRSYNLRIETIPTVNGEAASVRFLPQHLKSVKSLEELGFEPELCEEIRNVSSNRQGFIIITGPTGSGKTTTLYSILDGINKPNLRIVTVENPVEYRLRGLVQTEVNDKGGYGFAEAVPAFLRVDPNVLLVGEMRDQKTRDAAVQLAQTGHLVFATLHTNDAPSAIKRLFDLGATSSDLQESLSAVVAQRLARQLCGYCKESYDGKPFLNKLLGSDLVENSIPLYRAMGKKGGIECKTCHGTGYHGRIVVPSVWMIGDSSRELFDQPYSYPRLLKSALEEGMKPLVASGIALVLKGVGSLEDLDGRVVPKGSLKKYQDHVLPIIQEYQK